MAPDESYRAGFLRYHAERGEGPAVAERRAALLEKGAFLGLGTLPTTLMNLGVIGTGALAAGGAVPGYALGRVAGRGMVDPPEDDEYHKAEEIAALRRAVARLKANRAAAQVVGRSRSPYGL